MYYVRLISFLRYIIMNNYSIHLIQTETSYIRHLKVYYNISYNNVIPLLKIYWEMIKILFAHLSCICI